MKTPDPISRSRVVALAQTGLVHDEARYTRRITLAWLALYPGDLPMRLLHARALLQDGLPGQALSHLRDLCQADPEYLEAQQVYLEAQHQTGLRSKYADNVDDTSGCIFALGGNPGTAGFLPQWATALRQARQALATGEMEKAAPLLKALVSLERQQPLITVTRLRLLRQAATKTLAQAVAQARQQWPTCLPILLAEAEALLQTGRSDEAVVSLHQVASRDVTGQVAERWWGSEHPYRALWPATLEAGTYGPSALHDISTPARVAAALGQNRLGAGVQPASEADDQPISQSGDQPITPPPTNEARSHPITPSPDHPIPPSPNHSRAKLATTPDGRFPAYVILTTRHGLEVQYGAPALPAIENALQQLILAVQARPDFDALVFIADDPHSTSAFGLAASAHNDAWGIKRSLVDLDAALRKRGERIGALLIVGGPQVVPFHHLPNPVDDADADVPSDNPYACRDENYFAPEWPVGRLPGDASSDPGPLLRTLSNIAARHRQQNSNRSLGWWRRWKHWMSLLLPGKLGGMGYTAAVWQRASQAVYRAMRGNSPRLTLGRIEALRVSPPLQAGQVTLERPARMAYFNLHGIPDSAVWYGQRDPTEPGDHPHFPVALRPQDVRNSGAAAQIVFSEACYGAHILEKTVEQAMALKFLACGSQVVIGSTCTSYGSVGMPLIAADLLGKAFWAEMQNNLPAGEALSRAKITLVQEMLKRQGYLDGEDQKTLISFVLLGDPLARVGEALPHRRDLHPITLPYPVPTLNDTPPSSQEIPANVMAQVKQVVADYLPGMDDAHTALSRQRRSCPGAKALTPALQVITLRKELDEGNLHHPQLARLTLDDAGTLTKLAISR